MSNDYLTMLQGAAPAVPAEISAPKNEYMDMLQADADQRKQAMAGTLTTAVGANPDQYSAKRKVAGYLGYPVAAVEAMPKLTQQAQVQKVQEDTAAVPALQKKYQDADFAQLAHDDSGVLARIGHGLTEAAKYVVSAPDAADGGMLNGIVKAGRSLLSGAGPGVTGAVANAAAAPFGLADEILQSFDDAAAAITGTPRRQIVGTPGPEGFLRWIGAGQADLAKKVAGESPDAGFIEKSVMSGFQSAGQNLVALPVGLAQTGAVTAETAVLGLMGLITGGQSYAKGRDAGLSPVRASLYGLQDAGAEVITEKYMGLAGFLTRVKAGTSAARLALYEVFTEVPGEAAATTWQNFNEWVNVNPDKPVGDWIAEQPEALAQTIIATLVGGGTQIGAVKGLERLAGASGARENIAASVQAHADQLQRAMQTAAESKLRERDPEQFRAAVQAMAESQDGAPASVYVDAEVLNQLPPEVLNQLPQAVRDQLQDATVAGDVVNIPMGDALAVAPGTPLEQMLVEHGRIGDPMAPSQAEAKLAGDKAAEWLAGESAAVIQQANDSATMQESSDRVRQGLLDQLNTVGRFRAHVNEGYATWAAAFYTTMAGRMGITPEEMAARYPLQIVGQTGAGEVMDQASRDEAPMAVVPTGASLFHGTAGRMRPITPDSVLYLTTQRDEAQVYADGVPGTRRGSDGAPQVLQFSPMDDSVTKSIDAAIEDAIQNGDVDETVAAELALARDAGDVDFLTYYHPSGVHGGTMQVYVPVYPHDLLAHDPNILKQGTARGTFNPANLELALNSNADLSTFFHETGHFFLEVMADLASQENAPAEIKADMDTLFAWFGVTAEDWATMPLDQQRPYHERFAESMEQYLLEGKAPSVELAPLFRKFRAWVLSVYKSLQSFVKGNQGATEIQLSDEVRAVFDRMLASEAEIQQAEEVAGMVPDDEATAKAVETLTARSIRDLKWAVNARSKAIKALQAEAASLRREVRIDARREIMSQPVYRLWSFLSAKLTDADRFASPDAKSDPTTLDPSKDSLLVAIAKLGGIARDSAAQHLGVHADDFNHPSGVFGKPVFRKEGGLSADSMGAALEERGYLLPGEDGHYDLRELEELVAGEIRGDPQYSIAKQYFLESERGGEHIDVGALNAGRFDLANLRSLGADPEVVAKIEALRMTLKDGGIHPDILADSFGFADGLTMVKALADAFPPLAAVEGLTGQRMLEQHGDLVDQRAIEAAANQAVHNEARAKSLATELKTQNEMLNPRRDTGEVNAAGSKITVNALMEAAKLFAARVVSSTPVRDLKAKAHQHTAAERRAAKRWQEATTKGDTAAAVKAKQDQLLNNAAAKAAMDAMGEAKRILEFFKRVTKGNSETVVEKGRDADVVNAARAVLAAYGVGGATTKTALEYMDLVEKNDPAMFAALQPSVQGALNMAQPLAALTMEQLQGLHEEIQAMWHLAKRSRQMEVAGNLMDIDDAADELQARMQALGVPVVMPGESGALTPAETRSRWLQHAASLLRRVEQWAEGMDGKFGGPFLRLVFQPVKQAAENYRADRVTYRKAYQALVDAVAPSLKKGLIEAPELGAGGYTFGRGHNGIGHAELLHAILHTGNESNKRKLLLGRRWATENVDGTLDTSKWDAFLQRMHDTGVLGKVHYDFAQGVWDLLEQTKPLAQKAHRDVFGRYFAEVTADSFTNPFGTYRGGYVPAQADPRIVQDAALRDMARQENENMSFSFPGTNKGFTKGRVEYNRPLMLDLRTIGQHIDKVLLFSHMEPAVRDVNKLLTQRGVSQSLGKIDPTVYAGMLTPWLNRSARQIVETPIVGDGGISRVLSAARGRAGMALMFANLSNTVQQLTGFAGAFAKLKSDGLNSTMLRSAAQMIANPKRLAESVATLSPFMRDRMDNEIGAINAAMDAILLDPSIYEKAQAWTSKHAYFLQSAFDNTMGPIIWNSAYNGALAKGIAQVDAVHYADGVIRQTQGSTLPEDVSRIETGPAYARMFTQFIGYFNMMANTNATALKQIASETGLKKGAGKALMVVTMGMLVPIWVAEAIAVAFRGGPDDPEGDGYLDDWLAAVFGMGTIKGTLAMVPFVGQLANAGINRLNTNPADDRVSVSPAVSILEAAVGAPVSVYKAIKDEGNRAKAVRDVASFISIATGLPAMAVARPLGYLAGVQQGTVSPTGPVDAARGVATGTASPASKNK